MSRAAGRTSTPVCGTHRLPSAGVPALLAHIPTTAATAGLSVASFGESANAELCVVDVAGGGLYLVVAGG